MRRLSTLGAAIASVVVAALVAVAAPAVADHGGSHGSVGGHIDGDTAVGEVGHTDVPAGTGGAGGSSDGPRCWYEDLKHTTQEDQRTEIRPEETRPGVWGWLVCEDGRQEFRFFPDAEPVSPRYLADSVPLTPPPLELRTNPSESARSLVSLETWFWAAAAPEPMSGTATAGPVSVTVSATPGALVVDPGDGSAPFACNDMGVAYDTGRPAAAQSTTCGHTYDEPGTYTATATVSYDVEFTSNIGAGGNLGTIDRSHSVQLTVVESQAIVTR